MLGKATPSGAALGTLVEATDFVAALAYARRWPRLADCWECDGGEPACRSCGGLGVVAVEVEGLVASFALPPGTRPLSSVRWRWLGW